MKEVEALRRPGSSNRRQEGREDTSSTVRQLIKSLRDRALRQVLWEAVRGREAEGRGGVWRPGGGEGCGGGGWWWWWWGWGLDKVRSGETKCQVEGQSEVVCCRDRRSVEVLCWGGLCIVRSDEAKEDTQRVRCFSVRRNSKEVQSLPLSYWRKVPGGVLWRLSALENLKVLTCYPESVRATTQNFESTISCDARVTPASCD